MRALLDASGLGFKTVTEFVTDAAVLGVVRELGIDDAQGFPIGRPEPLASRRAESRRPVVATR